MTEEKTSLSKEEQIIEEIINHAYGNEDLIAQPCDECGSIECAICSDDILKLMQKTFQKGKDTERKRHFSPKPGDIGFANKHLREGYECCVCVSCRAEITNSKIAELEEKVKDLEEGLTVQKHCESVKDKRIAELEKENKELKELVSEIHKNKCVCCENRQDQGAFAPLCMSCWKSKPYYNGVIKLKEDNEKLREQNSKLADEFEKNLKFIKSDSCIYRDNPRITIQIKALEKIIKRLRGEKD